MKGYHFFLEYWTPAAKRAATRKSLGNHSGNIVATLPENRWEMVDCVSAAYEWPNSAVCSTSASRDWLRSNCLRVSEKVAREIHPNLFSTLASWEKAAIEGQKAVERERNGKIEVETIEIRAKEWFDRVNGNSYFSCVVSVNRWAESAESRVVLLCPMQYGYGEHYLTAARNALLDAGFMVGEGIGLVRWCRENGVPLYHSIEQKCRQRVVKEWGL